MVIFGIFLLPLRAAAMLTLILIGSLVGIVCNIGVAVAQEPEPHTGYRKYSLYFKFLCFAIKMINTLLSK